MTEDSGFEAIVELSVAIPVTDIDRALDFYCDHLGFEFVSEEDASGDERRIVTIRYGNVLLDLIAGAPAAPRQNYRLLWTVDDLETALEHLKAGGGAALREMEYGVYCADPDGNMILVKIKEPDPEQAQELYF